MTDDELEARLRRHYADRTAREPLPDAAGPIALAAPSPHRRGALALVGAAAAIALVLAGVVVFDDDASEVDTSHDPTSSSTSPTSTGSTTTEPSTTTSVSTTTTTTPPGSSDLAIVASPHGIMGWWDGSQWVRPGPGVQLPAVDGRSFTVLGIGFDPAEAVARTPEVPDEFCNPAGPVEIDGLAYPREFDGPTAVAVFGVVDPLPRLVTVIQPTPSDVSVAREIVASRGIDDADPDISQVVRVDLEGDGTDEKLMVIKRYDDPYSEQGEYSIVALRKLVAGEVITTLLHESIVETSEHASGFEIINIGRVSAVADLNGDGTLELVLYTHYYEGSGTKVLTVDATGRSTEVMANGCGV